MDSYTLSHYRRKAGIWLKANIKLLRDLDNNMSLILKLIIGGFVILYGASIALIALSMAGTPILYWILLKTAFVVALKLALPIALIISGIMYITDLVS